MQEADVQAIAKTAKDECMIQIDGVQCLASFPFPTMKFYTIRRHKVNLFIKVLHYNILVIVALLFR